MLVKRALFRSFVYAFLFVGILLNPSCPSLLVHADTSGHIHLRNEWRADESLVNIQNPTYIQVSSIKIESIITTDPMAGLSTQSYMQGLYYYLATQNHSDIPFDYIVGWDGSIYEGAKGGIGLDLQTNAVGSLIIGYIDNGEGITDSANNAFAYLLQLLHTQTGVGLDKISGAAYTFSGSTFTLSADTSNWDSQINALKASLKGSVSALSVPVAYTVTLANFKEVLRSQTDVSVSVDITNTSSYPLYGRVYAGTDHQTNAYLSGIWVSPTRSNYTDLVNINPNETATIMFDVPNSTTHTSYMLNLYTDNAKIDGSNMTVTLPLSGATGVQVPSSITLSPTPTSVVTTSPSPTSSGTVVILSTGTGYLNVHEQASVGSKVIGTVNVGSSFSVYATNHTSAGVWYQIQYDGVHLGWVTGAYTKLSS